jgi:hypothetical protein
MLRAQTGQQKQQQQQLNTKYGRARFLIAPVSDALI